MQQRQFDSQKSPYNLPTHPKIKPLIRPYPRERYLSEENLKRSLISLRKTSTVITTRPESSQIPSPRDNRRYMAFLKAQNSLSKLNYRGQDSFVFENEYLSSQLKNLSYSISSLHLQIRSITQSSLGFKTLLKRLRLLKNLTHVKITFLFFTSEDSKIFSKLFKSLLCLNKLKNLSLHFLICNLTKSNQVDVITTYLQKLTQLRALRLNFDRCVNPPENELNSQDMLNNLPSVFSKLTQLTKIYLSFGGMKEINAMALIELFKSLQNLKNLSDFTLNTPLARLSDLSQTHEVLSEWLACLNESSIRKLSLHPFMIVDNESLRQICQALGKFTNLKVLCINLFGCSATDQNLTHLSVALEKMLSLSSVNITFPTPSFSPETREFGIAKVISALGSLPSLLNLRLDFSNTLDLNAENFEQIAASIGNLTRLRFLDLYFGYKKTLSDVFLINLSENLQKLILLKYLWLHFGSCPAITNKGIEAIVNTINSLDILSSLALNFTGNPEIDEKMMNKIGRILQSRKSLYSLSLSVMRCEKLKEDGKSLLGFFKSLREAKHIQDVSLELPDSGINQQEMARLKQRKIISFEIPEEYNYSMFEKTSFL